MFVLKYQYTSSKAYWPSVKLCKHTEMIYCLLNLDKLIGYSPRCYHGGELSSPSQIKGLRQLNDHRLNKGLAFSLEERQALGLHGLLPPHFTTQEEQMELCKFALSHYNHDLNKFIYLTELQDMNEKLFFRLLSENVTEFMPIVYTPTVGVACQKFGLLYRRPRGLFLTINDRGHLLDILKNWPEFDVRAIVVTDGERILGLGDLGACGMGIPVGKLCLYTALGGIKPHHCLPVTLDTGTNNETFLNDPLYIGLRSKRVTGALYESFVDEFMEAVVKRFGQSTLIQFEDFANHNAFRLLEKYRNKYCVFNDDIQGTASAAVAGLLTATRIIGNGNRLQDHKYLFLGAGEAALGIANLTARALRAEGLSTSDAKDRIWMFDIEGLITAARYDRLHGDQKLYAKNYDQITNFEAAVKAIKPSVLIGASTVAGAFSPQILHDMASFNKRPVIFALSNPTSKAECTAEQACIHTDGRALYASGSPFEPVKYKGRTFYPSQGNNAYVFPGVALGVILAGMRHISENIFLIAAKTVANVVTDQEIKQGLLYPPIEKAKQCSIAVALEILNYGYAKGIATVYPEPEDKLEFVNSNMYNYTYVDALPPQWAWPRQKRFPKRSLKDSKIHVW